MKDQECSIAPLKPDGQTLKDSEKLQNLLNTIIEFYISNMPKKRWFGFKKSWYKIELSFTKNSIAIPYLYKNENITFNERTVLEISNYEIIEDKMNEFQAILEKLHKWEVFKYIIYSDGAVVTITN